MNFVTIDFSLNSPGICIFNDKQKKYHFIAYLKKNGSKKAIKLQEELGLLDDVTLVFQPDWDKDVDYSSVEFNKIMRYDIMSNDIINLLLKILFQKMVIILHLKESLMVLKEELIILLIWRVLHLFLKLNS